jgi:glycosyltransferase involved in cell wall biosynthesis
MRVAMLLESSFPHDVRVENEALTLIGAGDEVHLFVPCFSRQPLYEMWHGIHIHRFAVQENVFKKLKASALRAPFYRKVWTQHILRCSRADRFDAIHIHDLPLAETGFRLSQRLRVPWILDLHENFPAFLEAAGHTRGAVRRYFFSPVRWRAYESWAVSQADRIITVVPEALRRFERRKMAMEKFAVITNSPRLSMFRPKPDADVSERVLSLLYIGGLGPHRGLDRIIQTMPSILDKIPECRLRIVGSGAMQEKLKRMAGDLNVAGSVEWRGWMPLDRMPDLVGECDIGLVPHKPTEHTNTTIPHKLFQYMAMKKPVLVSDCGPLERVIGETGAGRVFRYDDPVSIVEMIGQMKDKSVRQAIGEKGFRAVQNTYNWDRDGKRLLDLYRGLES